MIDASKEKLSPCNHTECVTMTNREFLAYAFSENFTYEVVFEKKVDEDPQDICDKQDFKISLVNYTSKTVIELYQYYEAKVNPGLDYAICFIRPSFEMIETELKKAGLESFLD